MEDSELKCPKCGVIYWNNTTRKSKTVCGECRRKEIQEEEAQKQ